MSSDEMHDMHKDDSVPVQFRIDKKIPIAIIVIMLFQTFGFVWSAAKITGHIEQNMKNIEEIKTDDEKRDGRMNVMEDNLLVRIDGKQTIDGSRREADKLEDRIKDCEHRLRGIEKILP